MRIAIVDDIKEERDKLADVLTNSFPDVDSRKFI